MNEERKMESEEKVVFVPFFFDANLAFGLVQSVADWQRILDAYKGHFSKDGKENAARIMAGATATPSTEEVELGGELVPEEGYPYSILEDYEPNFGFRREHMGQSLTLEQWLKQKGMYELLFEAGESES